MNKKHKNNRKLPLKHIEYKKISNYFQEQHLFQLNMKNKNKKFLKVLNIEQIKLYQIYFLVA